MSHAPSGLHERPRGSFFHRPGNKGRKEGFAARAFWPFMIAANQTAAPNEALFSELYAELHRMAQRELARRGGGATIGVTTLLHEAYLAFGSKVDGAFPDRARFMGYAARVMRGLIIDHARNRRAQKRGGQFELTTLEPEVGAEMAAPSELGRISEALDQLAQIDAALAEVVDLKFFCGFSFVEIAAMRGISERTAQRDWEKARIYLHHSISSTAVL
jgi:RNA polymerase sigma factor (TIGR02999 family)